MLRENTSFPGRASLQTRVLPLVTIAAHAQSLWRGEGGSRGSGSGHGGFSLPLFVPHSSLPLLLPSYPFPLLQHRPPTGCRPFRALPAPPHGTGGATDFWLVVQRRHRLRWLAQLSPEAGLSWSRWEAAVAGVGQPHRGGPCSPPATEPRCLCPVQGGRQV